MSHPSDYKVPTSRSTIELAADADALRRRLGVDLKLDFDPLEAIRLFQRVEIPRKGLLKVSPFNAPQGVPRARVKFAPLRLMIDQGVWEAAIDDHDPEARFILNHEIGHMIEHNNEAKAFSEADSKRLKAWPKEYLAEWQADTFADHISLPWKFVEALDFDAKAIAQRCNVPKAVALRQIEALRRSKNYTGDACSFCGNFTLVRRNWSLRCDTCNREIESS